MGRGGGVGHGHQASPPSMGLESLSPTSRKSTPDQRSSTKLRFNPLRRDGSIATGKIATVGATVVASVTSNVPTRAIVLEPVSPCLQGSQVIGWPRHDLCGRREKSAKKKARGRVESVYPVLRRASADVEFLVGVMAGAAIQRYGDNYENFVSLAVNRTDGSFGDTNCESQAT